MLPPRHLIRVVPLLLVCASLPPVAAQPPDQTTPATADPTAESETTPPASLGSPFPADQVSRLVHPEIAAELGLDDQQRAKIQSLLVERLEISASPDAADQKARLIAIDQQIRDTLNADQLKQWSTTGPTSALRFQFREQAWGDVLDWFARQEGLTLVMNQVPPGTFTYTDTRSYNASEAIDLLNSVLLTRGYTLVRREKMLTVLQLSNSIPIELIPRVPLENLPSRGRFELVSVLFSLGNRPVDAVINEVQPYLGTFGRAIPLPQSKQLLVVETAGKMDTINVLINTVPEPRATPKPDKPEKPPAPVFAAYALGDLDPVVVLSAMKELVGSERIAVDEKTRLLTAFVIPTQQTAIQTAVEKMREEIEAAPASVSVAYPLRHGSEEQIREQVTAIAPRATVSVDAVAARVLITASPDEQARIAEAFSAMGISAMKSDMEVKAFQVDPVQSTVISRALQSMIPAAQVVGNASLGTVVVRGTADDIALAEQVIERWRGADLDSGTTLHAFDLPLPGTADWLATVAKVIPRAQIWLDSEAKKLVLLGSAEEKTRLEAMLPQLLTALPAPPERMLKTYALSATELTRWQQLAPVLAAQIPGIQPIVRPAGDDGSSELLVWATEQDHVRLGEAISQLKQATPQTALHWPKVYDLDQRDPALFSELLSIRFPGARVTADAASGQLTVWAEQETHGKVAELLAQISDELPSNPELVLQSYRSAGRTPTELQALLAPVIASVTAAGSRGTFQPIGPITVDTAGRRLFVMATAEAHQQVGEFVKELDKPMPAEQELILLAYSLAEAQATDVKLLIDQAIDGATVIADDRRQQLVVTATLAQHGRIKTLIQEVDRPASKFASEEIRAYELNDLQAATMLPTLQAMWPRMKLSVDATSNRIVASGNAKDHETFHLSIERLNTSATGESMRVETYSLPIGDLKTLPTVLSQIAPQAIISTDTANRAVVVWASEEQHKRVATAIEQLTTAAEDRREIEVHQVAPEKAAATRLVLVTLFPTASIGADAASGQLTILAPKDLQQKIAAVLAKTTQADKEGSKLEPRLYETTAEIRTAFTSVMATTVPRATVIVTGSTNPNQMMILASPEDHERVATLLQKLADETGPLPETNVRAYELDRADPTAFQTFLAERQPAAKILSGAGTNRLVISATEQAHAGIAQIIEELERVFSEAGQRELQVYPIRKDLTQQAVTGVSTEVPRARLLPSADPERILLLASPTEHTKFAAWLKQLQEQVPAPEPTTSVVYPLEFGDPTGAVRVLTTLLPQVVFAADVVGKSVAATGTAEDHETIQAFIQQYDDRQMDNAETKVFELGDADAASLSLAVTQMAPTARVTPDRISNRLIVTAPKEILERISVAIDSMESDPDKQRTTKSYELDEGTTYSLSPAIQGSFPRAKIAADTTNNRLIISATEAEHLEIEKLFDSLNSAERKVIKSYVLESGRASTTRLALLSSFPKTTISADSTTNHVIVSASEEDHAKIAEVIQAMNADGKQTTKNYALENGSAAAIRLALQSSFPSTTVSTDTVNNSLVVSASEADHLMIEAFVKQLNTGQTKLTKTYALETGRATTTRLALLASFPLTTISADSVSNHLIVSASEEDHAKIAEVIQDMNADGKQIAKNYALENGSAAAIRLALQSSFPKTTVSADTTSNSLIVSASEEDHLMIEAFVEQLNAGGQQITQSYALENGNAATLRLALQATYPQATIGADSVNDTLIVSAPEKEQQEIAELVQQINDAPARSTEMQAYPLAKANPQSVVEALQQAFGRRSTVGVSADDESGTVFVVGLPREQEIAKQVIEQMDRIDSLARDRRLKAFSLAGIDGDDVAEAVQTLFADARPPVDVRYDFYNEQLVVIGNEEQLKLVEETLVQFDPPERELEIFPLQENDPNSVREAVNSLFADLPTNEVPAITVDQDRQQLLIRATTQQLGEIRTLLGRLGENVVSAPGADQISSGMPRSGARVRTISVGRDSESLLKQLEEVWPKLRNNPLRVIHSGEGESNQEVEQELKPQPNPAAVDLQSTNDRRDPAVQLVANQSVEKTTDVSEAGEVDNPAVLILPGDGQWVIASEDTAALDMLAKLLEVALSPPMTAVTESGNLSVYVLKHGNAEDLEDLLTDLFQESRASSRARLTTDTSQTRIVADTRINALIVQSSRATRGVIEDLLAVLDSPEFIDSLQLVTPQIVPILHTSAQRVEDMLRTVYASQLSRGQNRPQISIPEGVSAEVASMLELINAENSGPLLTLSVDEISNSLVMRAPPELSLEIRRFVEQIDQQSVSNRAGKMRIIPLQTTNVEQMEQVLQQFLRTGRGGRGR
ncbi:secretin N-terminal domain-containing protein [Rhodopirellula sp. P2]|uniref:secretin N-terminal domain-containing protein n=1 Tax=Rhodopirellula sp. P2 TaxID=2127060 RepID=UPI002367515A|nr:secretin N-terminal domain-containing protein [Rhodopirellula sp. P2]WDQ15708.1 secretin N-terminal domain-containing protein [Rhodopirellula sp. P2]